MGKRKPPRPAGTKKKALRVNPDGPPHLRGREDGKVYYVNNAGAEHCVTDDPVLLRELEATCARHFSMPGIIELEKPIELAVLSVGQNSARCRFLGSPATVTVRFSGAWYHKVIPGYLITVQPAKQWRYARNTYLAAKFLSARIDIPALGLKPLALTEHMSWDPKQEMLNNNGNLVSEEPSDLNDIERAIYDAGPRPKFEMEQVLPGADPDNPDTDPIIESVEHKEVGDFRGADKLLMRALVKDLRCLDAHAHLGNLYFDYRPEDALPYYEVGLRIGELSLPAGSNGVLSWGLIDNRPLLRCLHGYGLSLWRLGRNDEALAVFERMLWLNPNDNQGARFNRAAVKAGKSWEDVEEE